MQKYDDRADLLDQANTLGLEFHKNIPTEKLRALIAESQGPAVKPDEELEELDTVSNDPPKQESSAPAAPSMLDSMTNSANPKVRLRARVAKAKKDAMKTSVVTITNKDNRENDVMTTVLLSVENQHFSVSKLVPLDIPIELEECLINVAERTMMTLHKDEIKNGRRTGNKVPVTVKKFALSYART